MSEEQQIQAEQETPVADTQMDVTSALLIYKNLQITTNELLHQFTASHKDNVTMAKVFKAVISDLAYDPDKFQNKKAAKLYQACFAVLKAKEVLKADMKQKLSEGVDGVSDDLKEKLMKEF